MRSTTVHPLVLSKLLVSSSDLSSAAAEALSLLAAALRPASSSAATVGNITISSNTNANNNSNNNWDDNDNDRSASPPPTSTLLGSDESGDGDGDSDRDSSDSLEILNLYSTSPHHTLRVQAAHRQYSIASDSVSLFAAPSIREIDPIHALRLASSSLSRSLVLLNAAEGVLPGASSLLLSVDRVKDLFLPAAKELLAASRDGILETNSELRDRLAKTVVEVDQLCSQLWATAIRELRALEANNRRELDLLASITMETVRSMARSARTFIITKSNLTPSAPVHTYLSLTSDILVKCEAVLQAFDRVTRDDPYLPELDISIESATQLFEFAGNEAISLALDMAALIVESGMPLGSKEDQNPAVRAQAVRRWTESLLSLSHIVEDTTGTGSQSVEGPPVRAQSATPGTRDPEWLSSEVDRNAPSVPSPVPRIKLFGKPVKLASHRLSHIPTTLPADFSTAISPERMAASTPGKSKKIRRRGSFDSLLSEISLTDATPTAKTLMDAWTNLLKSLSSRARKSFTHHKDHPSYSAHHRIALHLRTRTFVAAIQAVFHAAVTSTAESQPVDASELVSVADLEACMSAAQALLQTVDSILGNIEAVAVSAEMENVVKSVRSIGRPRESVVRTSSVTSAPFVDETLSRSGDISRLVQVVDTGPRRDIAASCFEAVDSVKTLLKVVEQALEDANVRPVAASPVPSSLLTQELGNLDNRRLSLQSPLTMESTLVGSPTVSDSGLPYSESTFDFIPEELRPFLPDDPARDLSFGGLKNDSPLQRRLAKGIPASDGKVVRSGTLPMFVARMTTFYFDDPSFTHAFMQTFTMFTTPSVLFDQLVERLVSTVAVPSNLPARLLNDYHAFVTLPVRISAFGVIRLLLEMCAGPTLREQVLVLSGKFEMLLQRVELTDLPVHQNGDVSEAFAAGKQRLEAEVGRVRKAWREISRKQHLAIARTPGPLPARTTSLSSPPPSPSFVTTSPPLSPHPLFDLKRSPTTKPPRLLRMITPLAVAQHLVAIDRAIYLTITPQEVIAAASSSGVESQPKSGGVSALNARFNFVVDLVTTATMSCDTPAARAEILVHWIKVANCCLEHLNLNAANAITASLNSASLHRLTRTWAQVPASSLRLLQSLSLLFSPYSNFRVLRSLLANIAATRNSASAGKSPLHRFAVPWFGIYLREIVSLCEVHKIIAPAPSDGHDEVDSQSRNPVLSFDRSWWVSGIVDQALQFQRRPKVISQSVAPLGGAGAAGGGGIPPEWSPWAVPLDAVVGRSRSFRRTAELSPIAEEGSLVGAERADGAAAVAGGRTAPLCDQQDLASYPWPIDLGILRVLAEDMADVDPGHGGTAGGTGGFPAGGSLLRTAGEQFQMSLAVEPAKKGPLGLGHRVSVSPGPPGGPRPNPHDGALAKDSGRMRSADALFLPGVGGTAPTPQSMRAVTLEVPNVSGKKPDRGWFSLKKG